jgi:hypothetical protein
MGDNQCEQMPSAEPQQEHHWLHRLVGEWEIEGEASMGPEKPPMKWKGTESVRSLGGLWIVGEGKGEMPGGGDSTMLLTLGFDPLRTRFVGTWIGSMMTHLWVYEGALDATGSILTLDTEGPDFADPAKRARFRDVIELGSDGKRTLTSQALGEDGAWHAFMTARYRRRP